MANRAETPEERRKREEQEKAMLTGSRSKGSLAGTRTESFKPDVTYSKGPDANDVNALQGDKYGTYKGKRKSTFMRGLNRMMGRNG